MTLCLIEKLVVRSHDVSAQKTLQLLFLVVFISCKSDETDTLLSIQLCIQALVLVYARINVLCVDSRRHKVIMQVNYNQYCA